MVLKRFHAVVINKEKMFSDRVRAKLMLNSKNKSFL